jgi:hypothetical protein
MKYLYLPIFWIGLLQNKLFKSTNKYSYLAFRQLYGLTNGRLNERYSQKISRQKGKYDFPAITNGIIGELDHKRLEQITLKIKEQGYFIFQDKLPEETCDEILKYSLEISASTIDGDKPQSLLKYDAVNPVATMYKFNEEDLLKNENLQEILFDVNFTRIAQAYLDCKPLNNSLIMWWSSLFKKSASSKAAQLYHFDMDHLKFIKFFIYLTDVDTNSGPHCFISSSHKNKPKHLRQDRRFSDKEIHENYNSSQVIEICGQQGTIAAVDTSGIHKGKLPINKDRLIVQLEFTNSFFGQKTAKPKLPLPLKSRFQAIYDNYKEVYQRFQ